MNPEQLWRPVLESLSIESLATHVRKALSFPEVELCLLSIFNVEIDSDPI